jgi:type II secretory pathway pseudopilin PulG
MVEILVTIALLSILLPAVMQGVSLCLSTADRARKESQAAALAHSKLSELLVTGQYSSGPLAGDFGTDWPDYRWQAQCVSWDNVALNQVDVTVTWNHPSERPRSVTVSTLLCVTAGDGSAYTGIGSLLPGGLGTQGGNPP